MAAKSSAKSTASTSPATKAKNLANKENIAVRATSSPATKAAVKAKAKLTPKQKMEQTLAEMQRMTEAYEKAEAERKRLEAELHARAVATINEAVDFEIANDTVRIERPSGSGGDGFCLRDEMRLTDNVKLYKEIQRTVRRCVDRADLDHAQVMREQDPIALAKVYKAAREKQPYLRRFKNDWATYEFVKMLLRNRRHHAARLAAQEAAAANTANSDDDGWKSLSDGENEVEAD